MFAWAHDDLQPNVFFWLSSNNPNVSDWIRVKAFVNQENDFREYDNIKVLIGIPLKKHPNKYPSKIYF